MKSSGFLYRKVYEDLKEDIQSGALPPGKKLYSEKQLSDRYGISIITVKTALGLLAEEGLVRRVPGKGTFVTERTESAVLSSPDEPGGMGRRPVIGVIFEHISSHYGLDMMYHMDRIAMEMGYRLCIRFSYTGQERESEEIDFLLSLGVCGLIIMPSHGDHYNTKLLKLVIDRFPVVLVDKNLDGIPVPAVYTDNEGGAGKLVDHLVERGYREIGLVTSPADGISSIKERKKGFYDRAAAHSLAVHEECAVKLKLDAIRITGKQTAEQNVQAIIKYLGENPGLDSLVCLESGFLPDIYDACLRMGLKIPEDMAVCSFDEDNGASTGYFFTHVKQNEAAIAEKAMELMEGMLKGKSGDRPVNYAISGIFMEGRTTAEKSPA